MPLFRPRKARIQPFFGYRSRNRLVLTARVLRQRQESFESDGRLRALRTMIGQFASREVPGIAVNLRVEGPEATLLSQAIVSDAEGFVHFDVALDPPWDLPAQPVWEQVELTCDAPGGDERTPAHVLVPGRDGRLAVISDIDDTIIETGITGGWRNFARNWRRIFAQWPGERVIVPGVAPFYGLLGGGEVATSGERLPESRIAATHRPFFYVSSSPWNLFAYLVAFQRAKGLPLGPLLLRDWGLDRATFGSHSHAQHKSAAIRQILAMYPEFDFALIGDDTQGDLPAFAEAVAAFPSRISAVFVRCVAGAPLSPAEEAAAEAIRGHDVALWLGEDFAVGEQFLHTLGFTPGGETEQIVKAVEKVAPDPPPE